MQREPENLIGESSSFLETLEKVSRLAPLDRPVLIVGERGTGKELIAARLHYLSQRWDQPLIKLNCAAINENLLESELFGHESGSFTGAKGKHQGRFELAHNGTLFLDELATSSPSVQEKLLRVIEYGEFERVGGTKTIEVDVRLIAATNEDLPTLAEKGLFRHDLLDRLAFDVITLPPLRYRQEDILILAHHFAAKMTRELGVNSFPGFLKNAEEALLNHPWPGNVRELKNAIERSLYLASPGLPIDNIVLNPFESPYRPLVDGTRQQQDIQTPQTAPVQNAPSAQFPIDLKEFIQETEIRILKEALEDAQFNQKKTAELLGLTYHQLRGYLKKYQLLES
ncbi:phage shock protein operon transcriptional activator [Pleionea sp. CnH1-48]|uniref:phage shock protein operon transcriptional activator n=1 Tax=Pleionea sp. CnH1-48 TaxID=2954494 RepID=UPI002097B199|nr:phage shock protein operon transcriptional activator [Pleionea sp. CnH1-48]MCO7225447.1 phage shock protein operon transcriptional activator [Pleionea sp. CnH1-48]